MKRGVIALDAFADFFGDGKISAKEIVLDQASGDDVMFTSSGDGQW